jgi:hypothetical protein
LAVLRRAAAIGEQSQHLHQVMHRLRDAAALKVLHGSTDRTTFLTLFRYAVDEIAQCFSSMSGHPCRVAVKQVMALPDGNPAVVDLSRSPTGRPNRTPELISENTDFEELMYGTSRYFMCNDLASLRAAGNYKNSHAVAGQQLPYNSALVWPVQKSTKTNLHQESPIGRASSLISVWIQSIPTFSKTSMFGSARQ